jgi:hypothetical protein
VRRSGLFLPRPIAISSREVKWRLIMKTTLKLTLLAVAGTALLAAAPASAQTTRHAAHVSAKAARVQAYPAGGVYLLENRGAVNGNAAANTNAAENFQDNFAIDY